MPIHPYDPTADDEEDEEFTDIDVAVDAMDRARSRGLALTGMTTADGHGITCAIH